MDLSNLHWIQYHILGELTRASTRRYSELRPDDVEGNVFAYHLKDLLQRGLIEKLDRAYQLTPKGLEFAGTLSLSTGRTRRQPKILTAVVCRNAVGEYLFSRWHRQPNIGMVSFPHGMLHYGSTAHDMAALELAEKAALAAELSYRGCVTIRGYRAKELDRHMIVHIFEGQNVREIAKDQLRPEVSEPFWAPLDSLAASEFVPGFYEIARLVQKNTDTVFTEFDVRID
jgi:ADP-ribose pyrophosphatase YjhB (NUDIX family)